MKLERLITPMMFKSLTGEIETILNECLEKRRRVHVLIEPEPKKRSTGDFSQNHHLNGHIQQISTYTGQPFEDVKKYIKQMAISMGYPIKEVAGNPVTDLWGQVTGISEKDATAAQCALLIECAHAMATDLGIVLEEGSGRFTY